MTDKPVYVRFPQPSDGHAHLRWDERTDIVLPFSARHFQRVVCMGNTNPPTTTAQLIITYREYLDAKAARMGFPHFEPLMVLYATNDTTPEDVRAAKRAGAVGIKVIPMGMTTGSQWGVTDFKKCTPMFEAAQDIGLPVLLHGTLPHDPTANRNPLDEEKDFLPTLKWLVETFPRLKISYEHVSSAIVADYIAKVGDPERLVATITVHHLYLHLGNVIYPKMQPHRCCAPFPKTFEDMQRLRQYALTGHPCFSLGTDTAPHFKINKETANVDNGVFSAPVAISMLLDLFSSKNGWTLTDPTAFARFTSGNMADFYGLTHPGKIVTYRRERWITPAEYDGIVPFWAGQPQNWVLIED